MKQRQYLRKIASMLPKPVLAQPPNPATIVERTHRKNSCMEITPSWFVSTVLKSLSISRSVSGPPRRVDEFVASVQNSS